MRARRSRSGWSPTSAASTTARSTSRPTTASSAPSPSSASRSARSRRSRTPTTCRTCRRSRSRSTTSSSRVGFLMAEATETVANAFPDTKFAIIDSSQAAMKCKPKNVAGPALQGERGRLPRRLPGRPVRQGQGRRHDLRGRRPEDPAGRRLHRRLPGRRQGGQPGHQDAQRLLAGLRRPGEVQGAGAQPDRARARRSSSRSPASAASARSTPPSRRASGHRRRRRPGLPRRPHHDLGAEEDRRGRFDAVKAVQDDAFKAGTDTVFDAKTDGVGFGKTNAAGAKYSRRSTRVKKITAGEIDDIPTEQSSGT